MLEEIQSAIREKYGDQLSKVERWSKFRSGESTQEWLQLLGPTAVVLSHQEHMVRVSQDILGDTLSADAMLLFCLGMSVHDIGEAANGDIAAPDKTAVDDENEADATYRLLSALPESEKLTEAYRQVVVGENIVLNTLFKAIERSEYLLTGIHVFEQLQGREDHPEKLWLMVARILAFDLPKVLEYAKMFPDTIGRYLQARSTIIDQMFDQSAASVDATFADTFASAKDLWKQWLSA